MRKRVGIIKRLFTLLLVFLISINSFAAIVSDNDGSAFITKAEFDALKSSFQSQIDTYNQSIDSKIDGAIASYLAGIRLSKTEQIPVIYPTWDDIVFRHGVIQPGSANPGINVSYAYSCYGGRGSGKNDNWKYSCALFGYLKKAAPTGSIARALCTVSGSEGSTASAYGNYYWDGIAYSYQEFWDVIFQKRAYLQPEGIDSSDWSSKTFTFSNILNLTFNGYISNITTSYYNPYASYQAYDNIGGSWHYNNETGTGWSNVNVKPSVTLGIDATGKDRWNTHLIQYDGTSSWKLSNPKFTKTFRSKINNYTPSSLYSASTKGYDTTFCAFYIDADYWVYNNGTFSVSFSNSSSSSYYLCGIGMLLSDVTAQNIYQTKDVVNYNIDKNTSITVPIQKLPSGLQLTAQKVGTPCEWEVSFGDVHAYNGSTKSTNANEIDIYLSYTPFSDKVTTTEPVSLEDTSTNYITTVGRKATIKWTNEKEKVIYVKCVPHWNGTSYLTSDWDIALDMTSEKNGFITVTKDI